MRAVLLVAAVAVGSGDMRDGAPDGRMVDEFPLRNTLRAGASYQDIRDLLGPRMETTYQVHEVSPVSCELRPLVSYYDQGPDVRGRRLPQVSLYWDEKGRLKDWEIMPWDGGWKPAR